MTFKDFASLAFLTVKWVSRNPMEAALTLVDCAIEADELAFLERVMGEAGATAEPPCGFEEAPTQVRVVVVPRGERKPWSVN